MNPLTHDALYIGGGWRAPAGPGRIEVISPSTEELVGSIPEATEQDVDAAVSAARLAFDAPDGWASWAPERRAEAMTALADALDKRGQDTARLVSTQNGMPIAVSSRLEAVFPSLLTRYYAKLAVEVLGDETRQGMLGGSIQVRRMPAGVVAAIVPWNNPQTLLFSKLAPALAAGCTVVAKPSPETVLDSYLLAEAIQEAGIPAGVINIVPGGRDVGSYLVSHPGIDAIGFTGSTEVGRTIAATAGGLLRPVSLELGGKSAAIVLEDADLTGHLGNFVVSTLGTNGETCFASTRILLPSSRYREMTDQITGVLSSLVIGDPLDPATQVGPLVSARQRERVEGYIAKGVSDGARLTTGGGRPTGLDRGWFVSPTVLADVDNASTVAQEEIFGPVVVLIPYQDEGEAIRIANDSRYGLAGTVWTSDTERGIAIARQIHTGAVGINGYLPDPAAPIGGLKDSGLGVENGPESLDTYLHPQSIHIA